MILQKQLPFFNVISGGVATMQFPLGMTYERIILVLGGTTFTKSHLTNIKLKLNGKVIWDVSGDRLDKMNNYKGLFSDATHLTIDFTELFARDQVGQSIGAIGTAQGVTQFTAEITISAAAVAPTLQAYAQLSAPKALGAVKKILSYPVNIGNAGKFPVQLPYGASGGSLFQRVNFFHTNMTDIEVKKNGLVVFESPNYVNNLIASENKKAPQAGLFCADFVVDNNQTGMLVTADAASMEWNVTLSAADTLNVQVEMIDALGNL